MVSSNYQLVIIGGGPAGLAAGLYSARARLNVILLEKGIPGGQVLITDWIDNYPGFPEGIAGFELIERMTEQVKRFGLEIRNAEVLHLDLSKPVKTILLEGGDTITCQTLIIATGARPNLLGVPGEGELTGKGVSYCATCDAPFFRDQEIAVVGGGDTAIQEAIYLTKFARRVTVIHRRDALRATRVIQEKAFANDRIKFLWNSEVSRIFGIGGVEGMEVRDTRGNLSILPVQGVFIFIGVKPNNSFVPKEDIETDRWGFIVTDPGMQTKTPGVMAAGDIRSKKIRQVVTAVGEGAIATLSAEEYLNQL